MSEGVSEEQENIAAEDQGLQEAIIQILPGAQLKQLREAQGLSVNEVAQALKFGVRQIEALERDDYQSLTGATFIRGFVRSYARFLKTDEAPLLRALEPQAPASVTEVRAVESMGAEMPTSETPNAARPWIAAGGLLLVAALVWFGWQNYKPAERPAEAAVSTQEGSVLAPDHPPSPVTLEESTAKPATPAAATTAANASNTPAAPSGPLLPDERLLTFSFAGTSWVEVRDMQQRVLLTGQFPPSTQQVLRGKPPFQLVVGNAAQVQLKYGDRVIDLQPYIRAEVARLTLDDNTK